MADGRTGRMLHTAGSVTYWAAAAPALSHLPAASAYRAACRRGDRLYQRQAAKRTELAGHLQQIFGNELGEADLQRLTQEWFRYACCEAVDVALLRRGARPLRRLVEIRGRGYLEAALAGGRGAILCSAHFGSYDSGFSVLQACGFPLTTLGRWQHNYTPGLSSAERRFWDTVYARRVRKLRERPNIEPWPGRLTVAAKAAAVLRANEVLAISIDSPPLDADRDRAVPVPFLRQKVRLLPGIVTLARLTGAAVLPTFLYRRADYRHQVLEISAPLPMSDDVAGSFASCVAEVDTAIRRNPAQWRYCASPADLASLGLIPPAEPGLGAAGDAFQAVAEVA